MKKLCILVLSAIMLTALFGFCAYAEEAQTPPVCETYHEAVLAVREQLKARNTSFSIVYTGEDSIDIEDVLAYEGSVPDEGDYLRWSISTFTERDYADGEDGVCSVCGAVLWTRPAEPEEPSQPEEPEAPRKPVRVVQWFSQLFEGLAKTLSNLIKLFQRMFGGK